MLFCFFFQAEDGIRDGRVTGVQTCALPICLPRQTRERLAPDALDVLGREARLGKREAQQVGAVEQVLLQRTQTAVEFVLRGGKAQLPSEVVDAPMECEAVIRAGALV